MNASHLAHISQQQLEQLDEPWVSIPLLGVTSAGEPIPIETDQDSVSVPKSMVRKETFALRVKGDSMVDENMVDGDIVIIERSATAENGESVVVRINQETVTMKKLFIEKGGIRLQPANPGHDPIYITNDQIEILGIVTGVLRQP